MPTNTDYTVIIDYAHSPDGLENIITSLREIAKNRVVTLFGCGGVTETEPNVLKWVK